MSEILTGIEERLAALPGPAAARSLRREALAAFRDAGFPTRKHEAWRYTDLKPVATGSWQLLAPPPAEPAWRAIGGALEDIDLGAHSARLVLVDGHYVEALSAAPVSLAGLEIEIETAPLAPRRPPAADTHPLAVLNTALTEQQLVIRIADGLTLESPLHLVFGASAVPERACQPRIAIELGTGATATVIAHFIDADEARGWINLVTELDLAPRARLGLYRLQEHGPQYLHTELLRAELADGAALELHSADLGGRLVRNDVEVALTGREAVAELSGLFVVGEHRHVDNHTRIDHVAPLTVSREDFRSIAAEHGRGVFNGKVVVHAGADGADARQGSENLLLGPNAEIDTKPELEIYTDDVKCSHGATVGEIDAEQLFYLRSRGLDESSARSLLTFAFANEVLERIALPQLRERVVRRIAATLPDAGRWSGL